jgi:hypothetical protein
MENKKDILGKMSLEGKLLGYDKKTLAIAGAFTIVAGIFFYGGAKYEKHKLFSLGLLTNKTQINKNETLLKGLLVFKDSTRFTLKLDNGSEKIIPLNENVTFGTKKNGSAEDFILGQLLVVSGKNNSDGTFLAENIKVSKKSQKIPAPQLESPIIK